jgi:copper homeostasis protein
VEGGTTPSFGTIAATLDLLSIPVVVLLRPRGGDFLFSAEELDVLVRDATAIRELGAFGIATGALTRGGSVDVVAMTRIIEAAGSMSVTFHRAFDMARDPHEALDTLSELGVDRILTSGQARSVPEGLDLIAELVRYSAGRVSIMPGAGIRKENVREVIRRTQVTEVHFAAVAPSDSPMEHRNTRPLMGSDRVPGEYERLVTDPEKVRSVVRAVVQETAD